jgi:hypothetical protein
MTGDPGPTRPDDYDDRLFQITDEVPPDRPPTDGPVYERGTRISSRYDRAEELEKLRQVVIRVPVPLVEIWVNSKACWEVFAEVGPTEVPDGTVARLIEAAVVDVVGGHNGLCLTMQDGRDCWLDPYWLGDDEPV